MLFNGESWESNPSVRRRSSRKRSVTLFIERPANHPLSFFLAQRMSIPVLGASACGVGSVDMFSGFAFGGTPISSAEDSSCEDDSGAAIDCSDASDSVEMPTPLCGERIPLAIGFAVWSVFLRAWSGRWVALVALVMLLPVPS